MTNEVNGAAVIEVKRIVWQHDDDRELRDAIVIGRAIVDVAGGGRFHGLILAHQHAAGWRNDAGAIVERVVVVWEKSTGRFACVPFPLRPS